MFLLGWVEKHDMNLESNTDHSLFFSLSLIYKPTHIKPTVTKRNKYIESLMIVGFVWFPTQQVKYCYFIIYLNNTGVLNFSIDSIGYSVTLTINIKQHMDAWKHQVTRQVDASIMCHTRIVILCYTLFSSTSFVKSITTLV